MNGSSCATCVYCVPDVANIGQGFCHRFPPTAFLISNPYQNQPGIAGAFPPVKKSVDWCAEYSPGILTSKEEKIEKGNKKQ